MATAGTHNYRIFMERGLPPVQSITRRWLRGSLLITICILAAALGLQKPLGLLPLSSA